MRKTRKIWVLCLVAASIVTLRAANDTTLTTTQTNGTWATAAGEFKIWALDHHRLRVEFSVAAEHKGEAGPMGNAGEGHRIAMIQGDTAIFKPEGAEGECRITLKFSGDKVVVTQTSICGFGHNVTAEGPYKKVSAKKPKFESD